MDEELRIAKGWAPFEVGGDKMLAEETRPARAARVRLDVAFEVGRDFFRRFADLESEHQHLRRVSSEQAMELTRAQAKLRRMRPLLEGIIEGAADVPGAKETLEVALAAARIAVDDIWQVELARRTLDLLLRAFRSVSGVLVEVAEERKRLGVASGGGPDREDTFARGDWGLAIADRNHVVLNGDKPSPADLRRAYIEIAGLAVAAVESMDRQAKADAQAVASVAETLAAAKESAAPPV